MDAHLKKLMETRLALSGLLDSPLISMITLKMIVALKFERGY